jgi:hypothetical protein
MSMVSMENAPSLKREMKLDKPPIIVASLTD